MEHVRRVGLMLLGLLALLAIFFQLTSTQAIAISALQDDDAQPAVITEETEPPPPTDEPTAEPTDEPTAEPTDLPSQPTTPPSESTETPAPQPTQPPGGGDDDDDDDADPILRKSVNTTTAQFGDLLVYVLTVTVDGDRAAEDVVVEDTIPPFFELVEATTDFGQIVVNGSTVRAELGTVDNGQVVTIRILVRVIDIPAAREHTNVAVLTTSTGSDDPNNNTGTTTITFEGSPRDRTATPTMTSPALSPTPDPLASPSPIVATATPAATAIVPVSLPNTGDPGNSASLPAIVIFLLGIGALGIGLTLRRRNAR